MKKRVLALLLTVATASTLLFGCGNSEEGESKSSEGTKDTQKEVSSEDLSDLEPVTLKWYVPQPEDEKTSDVVEAFNAKLAEVLPNTTVEFVFFNDFDTYVTQLSMAFAGSEKIDIAWEGWLSPYYNDTADGNIMELTDLINEYAPNIVKEMEAWERTYSTVTFTDGGVYGVPCIQASSKSSKTLEFDRSIEEYIDKDALLAAVEKSRENHSITEEIYQIIEDTIQKAIDDGALTVGDLSWFITDNVPTRLDLLPYQKVGDRFYVNVFEDPEDWELLTNPETPDRQLAVDYMARWYDKGWITDTQLIDQLPSGAIRLVDANGKTWVGADENGIDYYTNNADGSEKFRIRLERYEDMFQSETEYDANSTMLVLPYTCPNPERSMMLLNILHDEDESSVGNYLYNMLCFGFAKDSEEAEQYGWYSYVRGEADGQYTFDLEGEGVSAVHYMEPWVMGNCFYTYDSVLSDNYSLAAKEDAYDYEVNKYKEMEMSPLAGFPFDIEALDQTIIENLNAAGAEWEMEIVMGAGGTANLEATREKYTKQQEEIGLETLRAQVQEQLDAWLATK